MKKKPAAPRKSQAELERQATVQIYLIEHGGAPMVTQTIGKGKKAFIVTSPLFPELLPTLAEAMKAYPCKGHGARKPTICKEAKRLVRAK